MWSENTDGDMLEIKALWFLYFRDAVLSQNTLMKTKQKHVLNTCAVTHDAAGNRCALKAA